MREIIIPYKNEPIVLQLKKSFQKDWKKEVLWLEAQEANMIGFIVDPTESSSERLFPNLCRHYWEITNRLPSNLQKWFDEWWDEYLKREFGFEIPRD